MGPENDDTFSWKFDFEGQIYLTIEILHIYQIFDFEGRIYLKVETRIVAKFMTFPLTLPGSQKAPPARPKTPPGGPNSAPGEAQDHFRRQILYIQTPDQPQSGRYLYYR